MIFIFATSIFALAIVAWIIWDIVTTNTVKNRGPLNSPDQSPLFFAGPRNLAEQQVFGVLASLMKKIWLRKYTAKYQDNNESFFNKAADKSGLNISWIDKV
jgi:hypothetical protein